MPIKIPDALPARGILTSENIFVMTEHRAVTQDIRPLKILLLNLMPTKIETETQFARLLGNTALQIELELIAPKSHVPRNTPPEHMLAFYKNFEDVKNQNFDGMVITGAPVEHLEFEQVDYWPELCRIMEWSKTHVHSTLHICWGAQAGLFFHHGIKKTLLSSKLSGVFKHRILNKTEMLVRGFDDEFFVPHSRHTTLDQEDLENASDLEVLSESDKAGVYALMSRNGRQIFLTGHAEYDADTLDREYRRDCKAGLLPAVPEGYYPDNDPNNAPSVNWRSTAHMLFANWLNYYVYQSTPYDISKSVE